MTESINGLCNHDEESMEENNNLFSPSNLIRKKRDGERMTQEEIQYLISEVSKTKGGAFTDSQIGAWLMAVYLRGFSPDETSWLTEAMLHSGDVLHWPEDFKGHLVDKHSTGGVGDKISLPLAPALAACGLKVPMISGRGLGHTGGTLDKLESIPGFQVTEFTQDEMNAMLRDAGCFIIGQSANLVPADKKLYAVRDITATVPSEALAVSSIMSKKAAESLDNLILDVKCGKGAMMKDLEASRSLAHNLVNTGLSLGIRTTALITEMDNPIGRAIGNSIEIAESIQCLQGRSNPDLTELVCALGGHLLSAAGHATSPEAGANRIQSVLGDGSALERFRLMLVAQGVEPGLSQRLVNLDLSELDNIWSELEQPENTTDITSTKDGYVEEINAMTLALVAKELGAGREEEGASIDYSVGLQLLVSRGSHISTDDCWVRVYHRGTLSPDQRGKIEGALTLSKSPVEHRSRIMEVITGGSTKT